MKTVRDDERDEPDHMERLSLPRNDVLQTAS